MNCFFAQDNSCHWYMVEAAFRKQWEEWNNLPEEDESGWEAPRFAHSLSGSPSQIEFDGFTAVEEGSGFRVIP